MKTVWVSREFAVPADHLFAHLISYGTFADVEPEGVDLSRYTGRDMREGDHLETPFPPIPQLTWSIDVVRVDRTGRKIQTEERGGFIKRWAHTMTVTSIGAEQCRYDDHVVIEAGLLSGFVATRARKMYEARQEKRAQLLQKD